MRSHLVAGNFPLGLLLGLLSYFLLKSRRAEAFQPHVLMESKLSQTLGTSSII